MEPPDSSGGTVTHPSRKRKRVKSRKDAASHQQEPRNSEHGRVPVLWWRSEPPVPLSSEEAMIPILLRWGEKERGMMKDQPPFRLATIHKKLHQLSGIRLDQALSLRRHHMKLHNPYRDMPTLRLGKVEDINTSAEIFERMVETFLKENNIPFLNETDQKTQSTSSNHSGSTTSTPLTPDFLLPTPIRLKIFQQESRGKRVVVKEVVIHWIEAKMFYGASTIPTGAIGAVGSILPKVKRYVQHFGTGAIIFMQGFGDRLAQELADEGVTALSGSVLPKRLLSQVWDHQKTWCAREDGKILP